MKKLLTLFLFSLILTSEVTFSQVIISPYVVYMDEQSRYGSMIVQNESFDPYEISISFIFGYPISDSLGNRTMKYIQNETSELPSINSWVKAFPKKFILNPKERQTIRLMVKPPRDLNPGTYWTRIVTSSTSAKKDIDSSSKGVSAKLKFVLNQVTTAIFRKDSATTGLNVDTMEMLKDSTDTYQLLFSLKRGGNSPFFGYIKLKIFDNLNKIIKEDEEYVSIYFDMVRKYELSKDVFSSGKYRAEIEIEFNEKEDIPESKLIPLPNIIKSFEFSIP